MFEDKTMVADTLAGINGELMRFGEMIPQTENKELKTTLKQFQQTLIHQTNFILNLLQKKMFLMLLKKNVQTA